MSHKVRQELLNQSYTAIILQGRPSVTDGQHCVYRGPNGLRCGAAMFITKYEAKMEGFNFCDVVHGWPESVDPIAFDQKIFVTYVLQAAHDGAFNDAFEDCLDFIDAYKALLARLLRTWEADHDEERFTLPEIDTGDTE